MWTPAAILALSLSPAVHLPSAVWQVAPDVAAKYDGEVVELRQTKPRAVLLVHGLLLHPIRTDRAARPELHDWQQPTAALVQSLGREADVFAFGYAQTVPVDAVSLAAGLRGGVGKLRAAGYTEIVLVGHSAGGLIVRQFVERFPDAGVTKVIQVGSPNAGSDLAKLGRLARGQGPFVRSLAPKHRLDPVPPLPAGVEACCVVCKLPKLSTDALVTLDSQWPTDLRRQGVPATLVAVNHWEAMRAPHAIQTIAELARERLTRWTPEQVDQGQQVLFSKDADAAAVRKSKGKN